MLAQTVFLIYAEPLFLSSDPKTPVWLPPEYVCCHLFSNQLTCLPPNIESSRKFFLRHAPKIYLAVFRFYVIWQRFFSDKINFFPNSSGATLFERANCSPPRHLFLPFFGSFSDMCLQTVVGSSFSFLPWRPRAFKICFSPFCTAENPGSIWFIFFSCKSSLLSTFCFSEFTCLNTDFLSHPLPFSCLLVESFPESLN